MKKVFLPKSKAAGYPAPTLELPWSYPGPALPLDLAAQLPPSPPPPSPARPKAPGSPPNTRPRPTLQRAVNLGRAPSQVLRPGGRGWPPELGSRPHSDFPQNYLLCVFRQIDSRENAYPIPTLYLPYTYPTPTLEEAANEGSSRLEAGSSKPRKQKKSKRQGKKKKKKGWKRKEKSWKRAKRRNAYPRAGRAQPKARPGPLEPGRSSPLRRPLPAGESETLGKSRRRTAYPQQIVTTRLLYCLQDRFAQLSRLQRI